MIKNNLINISEDELEDSSKKDGIDLNVSIETDNNLHISEEECDSQISPQCDIHLSSNNNNSHKKRKRKENDLNDPRIKSLDKMDSKLLQDIFTSDASDVEATCVRLKKKRKLSEDEKMKINLNAFIVNSINKQQVREEQALSLQQQSLQLSQQQFLMMNEQFKIIMEQNKQNQLLFMEMMKNVSKNNI